MDTKSRSQTFYLAEGSESLLTNYQDQHYGRQDSKQESSEDNDSNNRTTDGQTMMHILKANIGTGVLAMPNAFKNVGLWPGFILVPVIGAICIHCMNILIASRNKLCDRFNYESLDYDQVAALGLACGPRWARRIAKRAHLIVTIFLLFTQVGFCCVYTLFVVENLQLAVLNLFQVEYSTTTYLLIVFPIIGLTSCTSNLKHLARISTLANILQSLGLSLIFIDLLKFHTYATTEAAGNSTDTETASQGDTPIVVHAWVSPSIVAGLPLYFATAVYAFEGIGVVLPLIKEMQQPARMSGLNGVLNTSMSMVALLYMAMGFYGYTKYGQWVQGSITLNLPDSTLNELIRLIFALAIGLSYSLQFYVVWTIIWPHIDESLFYTYRPRVARDKLQILDKLSAENKWLIDGDSLGHQSSGSTQTRLGKHPQDSSNNLLALSSVQRQQLMDQNSTSSTLGTSYSVSVAASVAGRRRALAYGTSGGADEIQERRPRNRLVDVAERTDGDDDDCIPEVQWRPPPRSMRGKRKVVRYTVILVSVSFTFVAAALIPRLDLFISLIGASASSCLAIIFPAIIQVCTFWDPDYDRANGDERQDRDQQDAAQDGAQDDECGRRRARRRRSACWHLFIAKNALLVLFGLLGLVTGTWISVSQLGALQFGLEQE